MKDTIKNKALVDLLNQFQEQLPKVEPFKPNPPEPQPQPQPQPQVTVESEPATDVSQG